jgi:hypothetical protein
MQPVKDFIEQYIEIRLRTSLATFVLNVFVQWLYLLRDAVGRLKPRALDELYVSSRGFQQWLSLRSLKQELHVLCSLWGNQVFAR